MHRSDLAMRTMTAFLEAKDATDRPAVQLPSV